MRNSMQGMCSVLRTTDHYPLLCFIVQQRPPVDKAASVRQQ